MAYTAREGEREREGSSYIHGCRAAKSRKISEDVTGRGSEWVTEIERGDESLMLQSVVGGGGEWRGGRRGDEQTKISRMEGMKCEISTGGRRRNEDRKRERERERTNPALHHHKRSFLPPLRSLLLSIPSQ